ncbi:lysophospholipase L1-like esterase [Pseudoduganella lurida]|uniref:Lysophospholipase L1-like esterase n=1 Tax=Pseudoduganella lurida TaxID=1036180 RepID=A0A562RE77_9BURK|nr:SGNH/GDSL hydrolase family protein [Pseudoduganella lurida]TWI67365.1 lysophospholipase L1-like esterase [Pseudoduganella lurida]
MPVFSQRSAALLCAFTLGLPFAAHSGERWATSWYASPQPVWGADFLLPTGVPGALDDETVCESLRLSAGGTRLRLVYSNRYGSAPVALGAARVGPASTTGQAVTFGGQPGVVIAPGAQVTSDPVALAVAPLSTLTVSSYFPRHTPVTTFHWGGQQTLAIAAGNRTAAAPLVHGTQVNGRLFLAGVLVETAGTPRTVVTLGDSITDGNGSTPDRNRRWPDVLAERLAPHGVAVANAGISGARLLHDGMGERAMARLGADVLEQPGVTNLVVLLGTNDIGWPGSPFAPGEPMTTLAQLQAGFRQVIAAAHARGVRVTGGTLPPFEHALEGTPYAGHYSPEKEALRQRLNDWIRLGAAFDAVVDFDAVLRDPARPQRMKGNYDSGDHLHPGDAGYRAMAAAVVIGALQAQDREAAVVPRP